MQVAPRFQDTSPRLGRYPEHNMYLACRTRIRASRQQGGSQVRGFQHDAERAIQAGDQRRKALWFPGGVP